MRRYRFLDERKFRLLCEGLTLDSKDMEVVDEALNGLDKKGKLPSRIIEHNQRTGYGPPPSFSGPKTIITLEKLRNTETDQKFSVASVIADPKDVGASPGFHVNLQSVILDIPQRVEIPLRYVLKGLPPLEPTYMVYLHVLLMEDAENLVYYGITKRGWMKRFNEHMVKSMREDSPLLFHRALREGIAGRLRQMGKATQSAKESQTTRRAMIGNHHVLCAAGLSEEQALKTEEYLVDKYSFGKPQGLNMIPGGRAGIVYLHRLKALDGQRDPVTDQEREAVLERYVRANPRKGISNPAIAQRWTDDKFATRVICSGEKRLTAESVRNIRTAAAEGADAAEIQRSVSARSLRQVKRVIAGKTYARVR
jgi:hypothetical protein